LGHVVREDRTVLSSSWPPAPLPQRSSLLQFYTSSHWESTISLPCISTLLRPGPLAKSPQRVSLLYTARCIAVASSSAPGRASGANSVESELSCLRSVRRCKCRNAVNVVWTLTGQADREDERERSCRPPRSPGTRDATSLAMLVYSPCPFFYCFSPASTFGCFSRRSHLFKSSKCDIFHSSHIPSHTTNFLRLRLCLHKI
jgi:hypothetical protein